MLIKAVFYHLLIISLSFHHTMVVGQKHAVFSDVDGTLVHYPDDLSKEDNSLLIHLPPSKTGTRGVISRQTLYLCQKLRSVNNGTPLILVSGMRTTTLFQRMPYLPTADAYVCESGGRIFYRKCMLLYDIIN